MWTKVAKPTSQTYTKTNLAKPSYDEATLTYDSKVFYDGIDLSQYTKVPKAAIGLSSLIQSANGYNGSTPLNISYSQPVTYGNLLVICVSSADYPDTITVSDNQNNMWQKATFQASPNFGETDQAIFYAIANNNNTPTVTLNGTDVGGSIYEYFGLEGTNTSNVTIVTNTATPVAAPLTVTYPSTIIAIASQENTPNTITSCGNGFTLRHHNDNHIDAVGDLINVSPGSYNASFNFGTVADEWLVLQVAFKRKVGPPNYTKIPKPS